MKFLSRAIATSVTEGRRVADAVSPPVSRSLKALDDVMQKETERSAMIFISRPKIEGAIHCECESFLYPERVRTRLHFQMFHSTINAGEKGGPDRPGLDQVNDHQQTHFCSCRVDFIKYNQTIYP